MLRKEKAIARAIHTTNTTMGQGINLLQLCLLPGWHRETKVSVSAVFWRNGYDLLHTNNLLFSKRVLTICSQAPTGLRNWSGAEQWESTVLSRS